MCVTLQGITVAAKGKHESRKEQQQAVPSLLLLLRSPHRVLSNPPGHTANRRTAMVRVMATALNSLCSLQQSACNVCTCCWHHSCAKLGCASCTPPDGVGNQGQLLGAAAPVASAAACGGINPAGVGVLLPGVLGGVAK